MALNCIVDDSALLAGIRENSKDSLKRWIADGHINLFVPLYTLERLNQLRSHPPPVNLDARKTLEWLDDVTSETESQPAGRVQLQGPDDQYDTWEEVEKYLLPDTPLSRLDGQDTVDDVSNTLEQRLSFTDDPSATATKLNGSYEANSPTVESFNDSSRLQAPAAYGNGTHSIPERVRPLLNFVVWRSHHEDTSLEGNGKYVLLTTDIPTLKQAQKFGVRAKTLNQVRTIVTRDGKRMSRGSPSSSPRGGFRGLARGKAPAASHELGDDEDEVVYNPSQRPGSSRGPRASASPDVWDPDHFGRSPSANTRGGSTIPVGPATTRGTRGGPIPRGGRGNPRARGAPQVGRGSQAQVATPIDPDSYARPPPSRGRGRGFGGRLWNPNT